MKSPSREKRIENRNKVQQIPSHFPPILCMPDPIRAKSNEIETMVQEVLKRATNEKKKNRLITNSPGWRAEKDRQTICFLCRT
jgi:hypothetical protein